MILFYFEGGGGNCREGSDGHITNGGGFSYSQNIDKLKNDWSSRYRSFVEHALYTCIKLSCYFSTRIDYYQVKIILSAIRSIKGYDEIEGQDSCSDYGYRSDSDGKLNLIQI